MVVGEPNQANPDCGLIIELPVTILVTPFIGRLAGGLLGLTVIVVARPKQGQA